ncbi:MAG: hypothetical protein WKF92_16655 [Pyrinomonadaceae bacterium]
MNKSLLATIGLLFLFAASTGAQTAKKSPILKKPKVPATKETLLPAAYEIHVWVNSLGVILVGIVAVPTYPATNESSFSDFLKNHFAAKHIAPLNVKREYPKIIIKFFADDVITLINAINLVRVSDQVAVELDGIIDDVRLIVSRKMTANEMDDVKPNPLTLIVEMNEQKNLTLNNDEMGKLSDMSALVKFLKDFFRQRADNGVFRENTNEIEKTVFIKMPLTGKATDLIKIAKALEEAGADPIGFQVDETANERLERQDFLPDFTSPLNKTPVPPKKKALSPKKKTFR